MPATRADVDGKGGATSTVTTKMVKKAVKALLLTTAAGGVGSATLTIRR